MNKVIIMRGVPGCGKDTYIKNNFPESIQENFVCSADDYFMVCECHKKDWNLVCEKSVYKYDPTKIDEAHQYCMRKFLRHTQFIKNYKMPDSVVVNNTNIRMWEVAPYALVGSTLDFNIEIIRIDCDPVVAAKRNTHGVPEKKVLEMHKRIETLPRWYNETIVKV